MKNKQLSYKIISICFVLLTIIVILSACKDGSSNTQQGSLRKNWLETTVTSEKTKAEPFSKFPYMKEYNPKHYVWETNIEDLGEKKNRYTLDRYTNVYNAPQGKSVVCTLPPFAAFTIKREGIEPISHKKWYYIQFSNKTNSLLRSNTFSYILDENISIGNIGNQWILGKKWIIEDSSTNEALPYFNISYIAHNNKADTVSSSKVLSLSLNKILGEISYYNHFYLEGIETALKDTPLLARLYWHHGESCPESEGNVFVAKSNSTLITLPRSSYTGEYGYYDYLKIYFPVKLKNGEIVLAENGDTNNTFTYPKDCNIPIDQLIIQEEATEEGERDNDDNIIETKNGQPVMKKTHHIVRYYRWTGTSIKMEKEIVYKKMKY